MSVSLIIVISPAFAENGFTLIHEDGYVKEMQHKTTVFISHETTSAKMTKKTPQLTNADFTKDLPWMMDLKPSWSELRLPALPGNKQVSPVQIQ